MSKYDVMELEDTKMEMSIDFLICMNCKKDKKVEFCDEIPFEDCDLMMEV